MDFLKDSEWDAPFFKRLAHNDTGQAVGHQAGMVLPKDLRQYLPVLDEAETSVYDPTTDRHLRVEMLIGLAHLTDGAVRYQLQTWGGTRSAESRITDGFQPLRDRAAEGDILVMQRHSKLLNRFRFILIKKGTAEFADIEACAVGRRWGPLVTSVSPITQSDLSAASTEITAIAQQAFQLVRNAVPRVESRQARIARSSVFSERIRKEYDRQCAVSGIAITTPTLLYEVESAHVVPLNQGGTDDIRNGFALSQSIHWAFDRGLFGVTSDRKIYIPRKVREIANNRFLHQFSGHTIKEAATYSLRVHPDAFAWHLETLVKQWE